MNTQNAKNTFAATAALFLSGFLGTALTQAATFWASPQGNSTATCIDISGTSDPGRYGTFARAVACAVTGDTVLVKPGTYTSNTTINNPRSITIRGTNPDPAQWPVLKPGSGSDLYMVNFSGSSVSNRTVSFRYIRWDMENLTGRNRCMRTSSDVTNIVITMEDFECAGPAADAEISGIQFSPGTTVTMRRGKIHRFQSVLSRGAHCIYMGASNSLIEYVECSNVNGYGIQFYNSGAAMISNNVFRFNKFHNFTTRGPVLFQALSENNQVYGNIFADWAEKGIVLSGTNNKVWNNTFYETRSGRTGVQLSCASGCELKNNIIRVSNGTAIDNISGTTVSNNLTSDPLFVDPSNRDFRLKGESPAIDKGETIRSVTIDLDGTIRPISNAYDIGAYEYKATTATLEAPSSLQISR
jgi:hypothetical protein